MRKPNPKIAGVVAVSTTMSVMLFVFALMRTEVPAGSKDVLLIVGGGLLASYGQIVNFYFQKDVEPDEEQKPEA